MGKQKKGNNSNNLADHSQKAYNGIRRMLYHKELIPGQKIAYRELAERLDMSPTPIIQALKWLEFQGLVYHKPNRGYFMKPFDLNEIEEIYELRALLELSLLPEAIKKVDEEGAKQLKVALDAHLSADRDLFIKERLFKNVEFHLTLASLSKKITQIRVLQNLFDLLLLKYGGNYLPIGSLDSQDHEHREIFDFMLAQNLKGAHKVLSQHISYVKKQVIAGLKRMLEEREGQGF